MKSLIYQFKFEFIKAFRDKTLLMLTYLMPLGFYLMMGFFMVEINPFFLDILIPSMVIFTILTSTLMGIPSIVVDNRNSGVLKSYKIYGINKYQYIFINSLTSLIHVLINSLIIVISANYLFNAPTPNNYGLFIILIIIGVFTFTGISTLIGVISKNNKTTILFAQAIYLPSMILSGVMVPSEMIPSSVMKISNIIPTTHLMQGFRELAYLNAVNFSNFNSVFALIAVGVISYIFSVYLFKYSLSN